MNPEEPANSVGPSGPRPDDYEPMDDPWAPPEGELDGLLPAPMATLTTRTLGGTTGNFTFGPGTATFTVNVPDDNFWQRWVTEGTSTTTIAHGDIAPPPGGVPTQLPAPRPTLLTEEEAEEERQAAARRDEQMREYRERIRAASEQRQREYEEQRVRRVTAAARAEELLRLVLTPAELAAYTRTDRIIITGSDGRRYEIRDGVVQNVHLLSANGRGGYQGRLASMCAHPQLYPGENARRAGVSDLFPHAQESIPHRDAHVAQILKLRHDAPGFWRRANVDWNCWDHDEVRALRGWHSRYKFNGYDSDEDPQGLTAEARAAYPPAPARAERPATAEQPRDAHGRFARRAQAA